MMPRLLVISSAPAAVLDGTPFIDKKFVAGITMYSALWDGPVGCILRDRGATFPFGQSYAPDRLPFRLGLLAPDHRIGAADIAGYDVILCGGDTYQNLHLAEICRGTGQKLVYIIEYIFETRRQMIFLDRARSLPGKVRSLLWAMRQERRRRRAFRLADGLQANGYPAFAAYGPLNRNSMMYLDSRVGDALLATPDQMQARAAHLLGGGRLRLIHSGRLEPMKGSHDLIPIARRLRDRGVDFVLDVFGTGSLESEIRSGIAANGLHDRVRLHGVVDFNTELVPFARTQSDIYLSCHRQSDPSCTYVESLGCGLAIAGYDNRMWAALQRASGAGWTAPMGRPEALADAIARAAADRPQLVAHCQTALDFARAHSFDHEFGARIRHLAALAPTIPA